MSPLDDLRISVSQAGPDNEIMVLRLDGVIDTLTAPDLDKVISQLLLQKNYKVVCDLSGINYVSSAGWGIFISHIKEIRENKGDLKLTRLQADVYEIFELLEFDTVIKSYDSVDKAAGDFARSSPGLVDKSDAPSIITLTLPDPIQVTETGPASSSVLSEQKTIISPPSLEEKVLALVQEDPLFRIAQIRELLKTPRLGEEKASFLRIFFILKKNHLLRLRNRCLYARQAKKSF